MRVPLIPHDQVEASDEAYRAVQKRVRLPRVYEAPASTKEDRGTPGKHDAGRLSDETARTGTETDSCARITLWVPFRTGMEWSIHQKK